MIHPNIRPVQIGDVEYIAENMRTADVAELNALGRVPLCSLVDGVFVSTVCHTLTDNEGVPIAIAGAYKLPQSNTAAVWLLGTNGIDRMQKAFLKHSRAYVDHLYEAVDCHLLFNAVHADNSVHKRWLEWLGFKFIRKVDMQPFNKPFIEFARLKG